MTIRVTPSHQSWGCCTKITVKVGKNHDTLWKQQVNIRGEFAAPVGERIMLIERPARNTFRTLITCSVCHWTSETDACAASACSNITGSNRHTAAAHCIRPCMQHSERRMQCIGADHILHDPIACIRATIPEHFCNRLGLSEEMVTSRDVWFNLWHCKPPFHASKPNGRPNWKSKNGNVSPYTRDNKKWTVSA